MYIMGKVILQRVPFKVNLEQTSIKPSHPNRIWSTIKKNNPTDFNQKHLIFFSSFRKNQRIPSLILRNRCICLADAQDVGFKQTRQKGWHRHKRRFKKRSHSRFLQKCPFGYLVFQSKIGLSENQAYWKFSPFVWSRSCSFIWKFNSGTILRTVQHWHLEYSSFFASEIPRVSSDISSAFGQPKVFWRYHYKVIERAWPRPYSVSRKNSPCKSSSSPTPKMYFLIEFFLENISHQIWYGLSFNSNYQNWAQLFVSVFWKTRFFFLKTQNLKRE